MSARGCVRERVFLTTPREREARFNSAAGSETMETMRPHIHRLTTFVAAVFVVTASAAIAQTPPATTQAATGPARWEKAIATYEAADRANPPARGGVLFV